jgi:hypothetical protein
MIIINESAMVSTPKNVKNIGGDKIRMECILQTAGDVNRNRRTYDKYTLQESIQKVHDRISNREFLGELDHPIDSNPARQVTVAYKEVSHMITEVGWDGNKLIGVLETLRTPNGIILKNLAEDGIPVGFSYRGMGDLKQIREDGGHPVFQVIGPLTTVTWDAVSFPSHKEAKLVKITEAVQQTILESIAPQKILSESNGMICLENGTCFLPNAYDRLVDQRINYLKNKFNR